MKKIITLLLTVLIASGCASGPRRITDNFTGDTVTIYEACSTPQFIYGRLCITESVPSFVGNTSYRYGYIANSWLFINKVEAKIDGNRYLLMDVGHFDVHRDNGSVISEWYETGTANSLDSALYHGTLRSRMALGQTVKVDVRVTGANYYRDFVVLYHPAEWGYK